MLQASLYIHRNQPLKVISWCLPLRWDLGFPTPQSLKGRLPKQEPPAGMQIKCWRARPSAFQLPSSRDVLLFLSWRHFRANIFGWQIYGSEFQNPIWGGAPCFSEAVVPSNPSMPPFKPFFSIADLLSEFGHCEKALPLSWLFYLRKQACRANDGPS